MQRIVGVFSVLAIDKRHALQEISVMAHDLRQVTKLTGEFCSLDIVGIDFANGFGTGLKTLFPLRKQDCRWIQEIAESRFSISFANLRIRAGNRLRVWDGGLARFLAFCISRAK